ncbi:MAG TPA: hypothetical protein VMZ31_18035 [Phycisphaerae bacterium]|nr:hypothetical protein [Phycisphaerae bacterium]
MARKRRSKAKSKREPGSGWIALGGYLSKARTVRVAKLACVVGVTLAALLGLGRLRGYVYSLPDYHTPVRLKLADVPPWLQRRQNHHILQSVEQEAGISPEQSYLDDGLTQCVAERLGRSGWVRKVVSVEKCYGGRIVARCEYRQPIAWVMHGDWCFLVDDECVRLPGRYAHVQIASAGLLQIAGVSSPPPDVGQPWDAEDLSAAIKLVTELADQPFREQIIAVLVYNYDGREDPYEPHMELATDQPGNRIRWGRAPGQELGLEPTAEQKLALLQGLYRKYRRVDMGKSYIDIRRSPYSVDVPTEPATARSALRS